MLSHDSDHPSTAAASVAALILDACRHHGHRTALVDDATGATLTFAELGHRIDRVGAALADRGRGRGDVVALWAPNRPDWLVVALGAMAAGCAVTGIGSQATGSEAATQLGEAGATVLVADPGLLAATSDVAAGTAVDEIIVLTAAATTDGPQPGPATPTTAASPTAPTPLAELLASTGAPPDLATAGPDDVAALPFSSGTTGLPKGVELTQRNLVTMLAQIEAALPAGPDDVSLALAPLPHVMGLVLTALHPLSRGAAVVTMPRFDPERFLPALVERGLTRVVLPPVLAGLLSTHPAATPGALSAVRLLGFGGAPTPPAAIRAVAARFPDALVGQGYGMTELTCVAAMVHDGDPGPAGSVGRAVPGTELRIVDPDAGTEVAPGVVGHLLVRGPQVMRGYRGRPAETAATVDGDGWLHTGDLARIGDDYLFIVGRIKELIKVKGFQVAPAELEAVLVEHPAVADAAVAGIAVGDDERPVAVVTAVAGGAVDGDVLAAWVAERVAPYKRLHAVRVVDAIPRNGSGKILRNRIAALVAER